MRNHRTLAPYIVVGILAVVVIIMLNHNRSDNKLVGVWQLESTQTNGQPVSRARELWIFRQGTLTIVSDKEKQTSNISMNSAASPKQLDTDSLLTGVGIYEIVGDTLRVSQAVVGAARPTEFVTNNYDMRTVSILHRLDVALELSVNELRALLVTKYGPLIDRPKRVEFNQDADAFISVLMRNISSKTESMTNKEEVVYHIRWLITEINNGGFYQFFHNSTGDNVVETISFLRQIGAIETAALVESGCKLFPNGNPSKDCEMRRMQLERFTSDQLEALHDLEEQFYARTENLNLLLKNHWDDQS